MLYGKQMQLVTAASSATFAAVSDNNDDVLNEAQLKSSRKDGRATLSLQEAVEKGCHNTADGTLVNPITGAQMTLTEAVNSGTIEGSAKVVREDGKEISVQDVIRKDLIYARSSDVAVFGIPGMSVSDAISCKVVIDDYEDKDQLSVDGVPVDQAVAAGQIGQLAVMEHKSGLTMGDAVRLTAAEHQRQSITDKQTQDASTTGDAGTAHGSEAAMSEVESEKLQVNIVTSSDGITEQEDSTESKVTLHPVSIMTSVRHDVLLCDFA